MTSHQLQLTGTLPSTGDELFAFIRQILEPVEYEKHNYPGTLFELAQQMWIKKLCVLIPKSLLLEEDNPFQACPRVQKLLAFPHSSEEVSLEVYYRRNFTKEFSRTDQTGIRVKLPSKKIGFIQTHTWYREFGTYGIKISARYTPDERAVELDMPYWSFGLMRYADDFLKSFLFESDERDYPYYLERGETFFTGMSSSSGTEEQDIQAMIWLLGQTRQQ